MLLLAPRQIRRRPSTSCADIGLCRTTESKSECSPKQLCLLLVYLFLRFENGIDKFLVRDLPVEMPLVYLELGALRVPLRPVSRYGATDSGNWRH